MLENRSAKIVLQVAPQACPQGPPDSEGHKEGTLSKSGRRETHLRQDQKERVLSWEVGGL